MLALFYTFVLVSVVVFCPLVHTGVAILTARVTTDLVHNAASLLVDATVQTLCAVDFF